VALATANNISSKQSFDIVGEGATTLGLACDIGLFQYIAIGSPLLPRDLDY